MFDVSCFEPLFDEFLPRNGSSGFEQILVRDVVEGPTDVGIEDPLLGLVGSSQAVDFLDGIVTASAWSEPVAAPFKPGFPGWFKSVFDHCLKATIYNDGHIHSTLPPLPNRLWNG